MNILVTGSRVSNDPGFVKWYLGIIHHSSPIKRLIFMSPTTGGTYKAAKEWATENRVNHVEYPEASEVFLKCEKEEIDLCLAFPGTYTQGFNSWKAKTLAADSGISILEPPVSDEK